VLGWPFLAEPLQRWLSDALQRRVSLAIDGHMPASVSVRLLGRLRLEAPQIDVAAPVWSQAPHMLRARDAVLSLHYTDLWRAYEGHPLRIHMLEAAEVDAELERLADGRASWQFGLRPIPAEDGAPLLGIPLFDRLKADAGTLRYHDERSGLRVAARFATAEAATRVDLRGTWRDEPVAITMQAAGRLPWVDHDASAEKMPVHLDGAVGERRMQFVGQSADAVSVIAAALTGASAGRALKP